MITFQNAQENGYIVEVACGEVLGLYNPWNQFVIWEDNEEEYVGPRDTELYQTIRAAYLKLESVAQAKQGRTMNTQNTYTLFNRNEEYIYADERAEYMKLFFSKQNKTVVEYRHLECWGMLVVTNDGSIYKVIAEDRNTMSVKDTYGHMPHVHCSETVNKVLDAYLNISAT